MGKGGHGTNVGSGSVLLTDWMDRLHGAQRLSELTLPGTHDTCARDCTAGLETQSMTVPDQLAAGIRFLDIRCRHVGDAFAIHHSSEFLRQWFEEVRDACYAFLDQHPGEAIVMLEKEEHTPAGNTRSFQATFESDTRATRSRWHLGDRIPALDEVRGKIVLFRRFPATTPLGIDAWGDATTNWVDDATFVLARNGSTLCVQDGYRLPTRLDLETKWDRIRQHLVDAGDGSPAAWYVNYASATGFTVPREIAVGAPDTAGINGRLLRCLAESRPGRYGTLLLDFAEHPAELIRTIVGLNRLQG
jgi:1-phosphatidylinositol phosphodiesterase